MKVWLEDACSLADGIRRREVKSSDAVEASLGAIGASKLNPVVTLDAEDARRAATEIDDRIRQEQDPGLFAGVPLLVKDLDDAAALPTSEGSIRSRPSGDSARSWKNPQRIGSLSRIHVGGFAFGVVLLAICVAAGHHLDDFLKRGRFHLSRGRDRLCRRQD